MMSPIESVGGIYSITTPKTTESSVYQPTCVYIHHKIFIYHESDET